MLVYLQYIIDNYDDLPNILVFTPATSQNDSKKGYKKLLNIIKETSYYNISSPDISYRYDKNAPSSWGSLLES